MDTLKESLLEALKEILIEFSLEKEHLNFVVAEEYEEEPQSIASRVSSLLGLSRAEVDDILGSAQEHHHPHGGDGALEARLRGAKETLDMSDGIGFVSIIKHALLEREVPQG